jgi:hypothetical protein
LGTWLFLKFPEWAAFFYDKSYVLNLAKKWVGQHFGDFFQNSSGHRARNLCMKINQGKRWVYKYWFCGSQVSLKIILYDAIRQM